MDKIIVSTHAIEQARSRVWGWEDLSCAEITANLAAVANRGKKIRRCSSGRGGRSWKMEYQGIYIIVTNDPVSKDTVIKTCLGDRQYHHWLQETKRLELKRRGVFNPRKARKTAY
jgi:hypothetical protein